MTTTDTGPQTACEHRKVAGLTNWTDDGRGGTKADGVHWYCDDCGIPFAPEAEARRLTVERAAQIAEQHAERLKHTSHRDGLGMGWLAGPITGDNAEKRGTFSEYRKTVTTRISDFTVEPGIPYQTPEGLRAEDEETRIAFDVHGGVYPIRESVFRASYAPAEAASPAALDVERRERNRLATLLEQVADREEAQLHPGAQRNGAYRMRTALLDALFLRLPQPLIDEFAARLAQQDGTGE